VRSAEGIEAARFAPAPADRPASGRSADPEDWEAEQIEDLLTRPESRHLRRLEIHMTDFHRSPERAARALAAMERPELASLCFGVTGNAYHWPDAGPGTLKSSAGRAIETAECGPTLVSALASQEIWRALPGLRWLALVGEQIFAEIRHAGLAELWGRAGSTEVIPGLVFGRDGLNRGQGEPPALPGLVRLQAFSEGDQGEAWAPWESVDIGPDRYPSLEHLDLRGMCLELREEQFASQLALVASWPITAQLKTLGLAHLFAEDLAGSSIAVAAARLAHLDQLVIGSQAWTVDEETAAAWRARLPRLVVAEPAPDPAFPALP
jgi:hypothetical protein